MRGQLIGNRYRIEHRLGEGGMATVYAALDEKLGRRVAIKILHKHLAENTELARRFFQEAHAISNLEHQNILKIFDVSSSDAKTLWIVSELLTGNNLAEYVRSLPKSKLDHNVASLVVREIVKALEKAHAEGVVHRDVKPENVFIVDSGLVKLMDFGIAKNLKSVAVTQTGTFMGSPHYMSPEQIKGTRIDPRSDLYSLGILYYELVTGRLPYNGTTTHDVVLKITQGRYLDPSIHEPALPSDLVKIICKLMSKNRVSRYQKAASLASDLDQYFQTLGLSESHIELERYFADPESFEKRLQGVVQSLRIREEIGVPVKRHESANQDGDPITRMVPQSIRLESHRHLAKQNDRALENPKVVAKVNVSLATSSVLAQDKGYTTYEASPGQLNPLRRDRKISRSLTRAHASWSGPTAAQPLDGIARKHTPPVGVKRLKQLRTGRLLLRTEPFLQKGHDFLDGRKKFRNSHPILKLAGILGVAVVMALMVASTYFLNSLVTENRKGKTLQSRAVEPKVDQSTKSKKAAPEKKPETPRKVAKVKEEKLSQPPAEPERNKVRKEPFADTPRNVREKNAEVPLGKFSSQNKNVSQLERQTRQNNPTEAKKLVPDSRLNSNQRQQISREAQPPIKSTQDKSATSQIVPSPVTVKPIPIAPAKPVQAKPAYVRVKATPACEIFINGNLRGTTVDETYSSSWIKLTSGNYQIELRRTGYKTIRKRIQVDQGQRLDLGTFNLEQEDAR